MADKDQMLDPHQLGELLGMSTTALRYWRNRGIGPKYFRLSHNMVRYRRSDVEEWLSATYIAQTKTETKIEGK